jgi:RimJ/RimL family protein N-acetyltransferase
MPTAKSKLQLVPISPANYKLALELNVRPDQQGLVAPVQKSLADAYIYPEPLFRLAFLEGVVVGYLLLFPFDSDRGRMVNIVRLMIDQRFQGQGLGRHLLLTTLNWIKTFEPMVETVRISTLLHNDVALRLYESVGFIREGVKHGRGTPR